MRINSKTCTVCKEVQPIAAYHRDAKNRDGKRTDCKTCCNKRRKKHYKTKEGLLLRRYGDMKKRVEGRDHNAVSSVGKPILPKEEFFSWALNNPDFHYLYRDWVESGYQTKYAPSVDRIDERFGYELFNMQFVTQSENARRAIHFRHYNKIV
jgi:hypothetical protein